MIAKGDNSMFFNLVNTPGGDLVLYSEDGTKLDGTFFIETKAFGKDLVDQITSYKCDNESFAAAKRWLDMYKTGASPEPYWLELDPKGTEFQKRIWGIVAKIPFGETLTYKQVGEIYMKNYDVKTVSHRSIGAAIGQNPYTVIVPCHRVIGSDGSMKGYAAGIEIKKCLLKFERDTREKDENSRKQSLYYDTNK